MREPFVSFELTPAEFEQLAALPFQSKRPDSQCQIIVRDYLRRKKFQAERIARKQRNRDREAKDRVQELRDAGAL